MTSPWRGVVLGLLIVNAAVAWGGWYWLQQQLGSLRAQSSIPPINQELPSAVSNQMPSTQTATPPQTASLAAAISVLQTQVASLSQQLAKVSSSPKITTSPGGSTTYVNSSVKEYYVYMGTGNTTNRDWTDMTSAAATIDVSKYGKIKELRFEAALSIIGGEAHARLINKTNQGLIGNSEIFHNTNASTWVTSGALPIPTVSTPYMVQLRSSSGERANLDGARIKIIVE